MLKKNITYTDYNGVTRSEDFYFNLSKAELVEMQASVDGGLNEYLHRIAQRGNVPEIMSFFKKLVLKSYGEKSADGRRFVKSKELSDAFSQTEAYSELFMELNGSSESAANFLKGVMPEGFIEEAAKQLEEADSNNESSSFSVVE